MRRESVLLTCEMELMSSDLTEPLYGRECHLSIREELVSCSSVKTSSSGYINRVLIALESAINTSLLIIWDRRIKFLFSTEMCNRESDGVVLRYD